MPGALIVTMIPQNQTPYNPIVWVISASRSLLDRLLNLFHCLRHISSFEKSEGPMPVARAICYFRSTMQLRLSTDNDCLLVKLVQIEQKCKVAVGRRISSWVYFETFPPMLNCWIIKFKFKIAQTKIILKLCVFIIKCLGLNESLDCVVKISLLIQSYTIVELPFER